MCCQKEKQNNGSCHGTEEAQAALSEDFLMVENS